MKKLIVVLSFLAFFSTKASALHYLYCGPSGYCWEVNGNSIHCTGGCMGGPWMEQLNVCVNVSQDGETGCDGRQINHDATSVLVNYFSLNNAANIQTMPQEDYDDFMYKLNNQLFTVTYIDGTLLNQQVLAYFQQN